MGSSYVTIISNIILYNCCGENWVLWTCSVSRVDERIEWNFSSLFFYGKFCDSIFFLYWNRILFLRYSCMLTEKQVYFGMLCWPPDDLRQEHLSFTWSRGKRRLALFPPFALLLFQPTERGIFLLNAIPEWICVISFNYTAMRALKFTLKKQWGKCSFHQPFKVNDTVKFIWS